MKTLLLLLIPLGALTQTWPTKDCPDRPYTKGNNNIIYHTCDCGQRDGNYWSTLITIRMDSVAQEQKWTSLGTKTLYHHTSVASDNWDFYPGKKGYFTEWDGIGNVRVYNMETNKNKYYTEQEFIKLHPDSIICPMCHQWVAWRHILVRKEFGYFEKMHLDDRGLPLLTPFGKWAMPREYEQEPLDSFYQFKKYLPRGFLSDKHIRNKWAKLLANN